MNRELLAGSGAQGPDIPVFVVVFLIVGVTSGLVAVAQARDKGRTWLWFLGGLLFPILGNIILAAVLDLKDLDNLRERISSVEDELRQVLQKGGGSDQSAGNSGE